MTVYQEQDTFVFAPETPTDIFANCHSDWGVFMTKSRGDYNLLSAKEAGILRGNKASFALVAIETRLTMFPMDKKPEQRPHIWAIATEGELRTGMNEKVGELVNFLTTAISGDKLQSLLKELEFKAFNNWLSETKGKGNYEEVQDDYIKREYHSVIFDAEFKKETKGKFPFHVLEFKMRAPKNQFEKNILKIAHRIHEDNIQGFSHPRLEENQLKALARLTPQKEVKTIESGSDF